MWMSKDRWMDEMASSMLGFHFLQQYSLENSGLDCLTVGNIANNQSIQIIFSRALFVCEFNSSSGVWCSGASIVCTVIYKQALRHTQTPANHTVNKRFDAGDIWRASHSAHITTHTCTHASTMCTCPFKPVPCANKFLSSNSAHASN